MKYQDSSKDKSPRVFKDLTGQRFGKLVVINLANRGKDKEGVSWHCQCDCGKQTTVHTKRLKSGNTQSCGCGSRGNRKSHGLTLNGKPSRELATWYDIIKRCENPNFKYFYNYGGRGIQVIGKLRFGEGKKTGVEFMIEDIGLCPGPDYSIDRIDNNGNYELGNIRWATRTEQNMNKRNTLKITYNGITATLPEWSKITGIPRNILRARRNHKWEVWRMLTQTPYKRATEL